MIVIWLIAFVLAAHAFAHLPGFVVPWQLMTSPDMPYKTTVLAGHLNVGDTGIRIVGLLWLAVAALVAAAAVSWAMRSPSAASLTMLAALVSLATCLVEMPEAWIGVAVNVALLLATPLLGGTAWQYTTDRTVQAMVLARVPVPAATRPHEIGATLPAPVARYFAHVLPPGHPRIRSAELMQQAEFFVGGGWKPLRASQHFVTEPPGFVWNARITMAAGLPVFVRDSYIEGAGTMHGEFAGVFPIVNQRGDPRLDAGALHRYVAESVWLPTALLPGPHLSWTAIDDDHALATFTDAHTTVSLRFRFTREGDVAEIHVSDRAREDHGAYIPTPWTVRCEEYGVFSGMRIPVRCSVQWEMPDGPLPYWRGTITSARYAYAEPDGRQAVVRPVD